MARVKQEIREVMRELGHDNLTLKQFVELLRYGKEVVGWIFLKLNII